MSVTTVLLVEDEESFIDALVVGLRNEGFLVHVARDGVEALSQFELVRPDLVLLDVMLPKLSGIDVCRELRSRSNVPIIMVTAKGAEIDTVVGLEVGADDYVTKPFDLRELLARIKAVLRRLAPVPAAPDAGAAPSGAGPALPVPAAPARTVLRFDGWALDTAARRLLSPAGQDVQLTTGEFDLLAAFAQHPGRVLSRDFLLEQTRGREAGPFDRTIDVQVGRLRRKLDDDAENPQLIKSVRGAGYLFVPAVHTG